MSNKNIWTLVLTGSLVATGAQAIDKVKNVNLSPSQFAPTPVIHVMNDGHDFTHVQGATTFSGVGSGECKGANKVQNASFGLGTFSIGGGLMEYAPNQVYSSSVGGTGNKSISGGVSVDVPAESAGLGGVGIYSDPVQLCNVMKDSQVAGGSPSWAVLKNGMQAEVSKQISYAIRCQFNNVGSDIVYWEQKTIEVPAIVQCEGNPNVKSPAEGGPQQLTVPFQIMDATIEVEPEVDGYCRVGFDVPVGIKIRSNGMPGHASFRLRDNGAWGGVHHLNFTETAVEFETEVMLHIASDASSDGNLNQYQTNPGGGGGPADQFLGNDDSPLHQLALKVLDPGNKIWDTAMVRIECRGPKRNPAIGELPDGIQVQPRPPTAPAAPSMKVAPAATPPTKTLGRQVEKTPRNALLLPAVQSVRKAPARERRLRRR